MLPVVGVLVGQAELMRMFGVKRTQARNLTLLDDFPDPFDADLTMGKVWLRDDVRRWAAAHGRPVFDEPDTTEAADE